MSTTPDIKTVEHMIVYQYTKIIAKSRFNYANGKKSKRKSFCFIKNTARKLISGKIKRSDIEKED